MKRKLIGLIFMILIFSSFIGKSIATNDNIIIFFNIDYGNNITENEYVTLGLNLEGESFDPSNVGVEFSTDNNKWYGYDNSKEEWKSGIKSKYQPFYPKFYIGNNNGLVTIYVRVTNSAGRVFKSSKKIYYSTESNKPKIYEPISIHNPSYSSSYYKANIYSGGGILDNPYYINDNKTSIILDCINSYEASYSTDSKNFSSWERVYNNKINLNVTLSKTQGEKVVYIKTRNEYGIESNINSLYYIYDNEKPNLKLTNIDNSINSNNSKKFEIEVLDNISNSLDFEVKLHNNGNSINKSGQLKIYKKNTPTIIPIIINGLENGNYYGSVTVRDSSGNITVKSFQIEYN